jgi:hypothetical protein
MTVNQEGTAARIRLVYRLAKAVGASAIGVYFRIILSEEEAQLLKSVFAASAVNPKAAGIVILNDGDSEFRICGS